MAASRIACGVSGIFGRPASAPASRDLHEQLVAGAARARRDVDARVAEQRLVLDHAFEARLAVGGLGQRLAVDDLRAADVGVDAVLAPQPVDDDVQVQLAHAADDRLSGLRVFVGVERRILVGQLLEPEVELLSLGLRLGLDGARDHRFVDVDALEDDRRLGRRQRVAGPRVLEPGRDDDAARAGALDRLAPVRVHGEQPRHLLVPARARVVDLVARAQHARVDAQVDRLAPLLHRRP